MLDATVVSVKSLYSAKHGIAFSPRSGFQARCLRLPPIFWSFIFFLLPHPIKFGWHRRNNNISHYISLSVSQYISLSVPILGLSHSTSSHWYRSAISVLGFRPQVPARRFAGSGLAPKTKVFVSAKRFGHVCSLFDSVASIFVVLICMQRRRAFEELLTSLNLLNGAYMCLQNLTSIHKSQSAFPKP